VKTNLDIGSAIDRFGQRQHSMQFEVSFQNLPALDKTLKALKPQAT